MLESKWPDNVSETSIISTLCLTIVPGNNNGCTTIDQYLKQVSFKSSPGSLLYTYFNWPPLRLWSYTWSLTGRVRFLSHRNRTIRMREAMHSLLCLRTHISTIIFLATRTSLQYNLASWLNFCVKDYVNIIYVFDLSKNRQFNHTQKHILTILNLIWL